MVPEGFFGTDIKAFEKWLRKKTSSISLHPELFVQGRQYQGYCIRRLDGRCSAA